MKPRGKCEAKHSAKGAGYESQGVSAKRSIAPKARDMKARGKSRLCRDVAPGSCHQSRRRALKGRNTTVHISAFQASPLSLVYVTRGDV